MRYSEAVDESAVRGEIARLVREGFLTAEQGELVDHGQLVRFFATDVGQQLRTSPNVLREFKFSILEDATAFDPELKGEKVLLQGVVDCALMDDDGITVIDFKTDRVTEDTVTDTAERYRPQVEAYANALSKIFEKSVKQKYLYFFALDRLVPL